VTKAGFVRKSVFQTMVLLGRVNSGSLQLGNPTEMALNVREEYPL